MTPITYIENKRALDATDLRVKKCQERKENKDRISQLATPDGRCKLGRNDKSITPS